MGEALKFGKYSGRTLQEVFEVDPGYVRWLEKTTREQIDDPEKEKYRFANQKKLKEIQSVLGGGLTVGKVEQLTGGKVVKASDLPQKSNDTDRLEKKVDKILDICEELLSKKDAVVVDEEKEW